MTEAGPAKRNAAHRPAWLWSVEMLGTTVVVLMISAAVLWGRADDPGAWLGVGLGAGVVVYVAVVIALGRGATASGAAWWPFAIAGAVAGGVTEIINAELLFSREFVAALLTGGVIGTAQWVALRTWLRLTRATPR
jgi:hypothetical protein